jgi:hypothetical protein
MKRKAALVAALLAFSSLAGADTIGYWQHEDGDALGVAGSVKNDLFVSTDTDWTNNTITLYLTSGSFIDPDTAPFGADVYQNFGPGFDNDLGSWLTVPGEYPGVSPAAPTVIYFNGDDPSNPNDTHYFDWFDTAFNGPVTDQLAARLFLSDDAQGEWMTWVLEGSENKKFYGTIVDGAMVPEPASLLVLGAGAGLAVLRRRRAC